MIKFWHIWSDPLQHKYLEAAVNNLSFNDSLVICSAEESYFPASELIEKTVPIIDNQWPDSFGNFEKFKEKLKSLKSVDIILGSNDPKVLESYLELGTVHPWPNFFLYRSMAKINKTKLSNNNFKKLFLSMNTKAHYHRCEMFDLLCHFNLLDRGIYSWHNHPTRREDIKYKWKFWTPAVVTFDNDYQADSLSRVDQQHIIPKEFNDAFIILVTETYVDQIFITEKTWQPILVEKPFLVYSAQHFYKSLTQQGFELYDEIFDYSFDQEPDNSKRAELICQELIKIKDLNLEELHNKIKHKLTKNKKIAHNIIKNKIGVPKIVSQFEHYNNLKELV